MEELVDARGLSCPLPVVKTREALQRGADRLEVLVDNPTARDNVSRFASSQGFRVEVSEEGDLFRLRLEKTGPGGERSAAPAEGATPLAQKVVVVISADVMGRGDEELGGILIKAFLNTLAESDPPPWRMVLFNRGVLLALEGAETVPALANLSDLGVEILVCGTCLDFFGVKDRVAVGTVSNMYEILNSMMMASNSITI